MCIYIYSFEKEERIEGKEQWREFIFGAGGKRCPWSLNGWWPFASLQHSGATCYLKLFQGKKQMKRKKRGHLDYKMESVNKRHFQGTTFNCWETIHYSTSTIRVIYRGGGGTGERLTLLPVSQMAQTSYVCQIKSFFYPFSANCTEGLGPLQRQVSQHSLLSSIQLQI